LCVLAAKPDEGLRHFFLTIGEECSMETKVYVGNLPYSARDDSLQELFSQAGTVVSANVITDRESGRSKGFGFVEMGSPEEAEKAIQMFNGYSLEGRDLRVNIARPREERPRGGRDRRGGGGGGGNRRY
jgi:RNA recognition motif-containing protein